MPGRQPLDPGVVCGLIVERGDGARAKTYEHRWERGHAVWRAVVDALEAASLGVEPAERPTRPPKWLDATVREHLERMAAQGWASGFDTIRTLEQLGLVHLEPDDTYVLAVVNGVGDRFESSRAAALRSDPDLMDRVVWRMFEVEGGGEVSLANVDKFSAEPTTWRAAFVELTTDGTLPRDRVLTSALEALNRDFSAYRARWYSQLYDALEPSIEELTTHQQLLRALLRSLIGSTVALAVRRLALLGKHGLVDGAATLPSLQAAVVSAPKTTAVAAVALVGAVVSRSPELGAEAADVAIAALGHPHADVQRAAARLLSTIGAQDRLEAAAELLEPSVRVDVVGLPGNSAPEADAPAPAELAPAPLRPVADDLLDRVAALLEDASDAMELELVLARLAAVDDTSVLQPLTKRARSILDRGPRELVAPFWLRGQLARLVLAAAGTEVPASERAEQPTLRFLLARLAHVEAVLRRRMPPGTLLATPDHPLGWVDPLTLVERLQRSGEGPATNDLVAALLRLHPDGRAAAVQRAQDERGALRGHVATVVRYGLGAPVPSGATGRSFARAVRSHLPWWVAASRSRLPFDRDDWLVSHAGEGAGRTLPIDAAVEFHGEPYSWQDHDRMRTAIHWNWTIAVASPSPEDDEIPTGVSGGPHAWLSPDHEDFVGWLGLIWLHDCEHLSITGIHPVLRAMTSTEVSHDAPRVLGAIGRHPGRLGSLTSIALAAGLAASRADQRASAVDAVLQHHGAGNLDAELLARGIVSIREPATLTRLATTLRDISATRPAARDLVIGALASALPRYEMSTRGMHGLLELLREDLLRGGRPTPPELHPWLRAFQGQSRASRVAAALLAGE